MGNKLNNSIYDHTMGGWHNPDYNDPPPPIYSNVDDNRLTWGSLNTGSTTQTANNSYLGGNPNFNDLIYGLIILMLCLVIIYIYVTYYKRRKSFGYKLNYIEEPCEFINAVNLH
jgi:hypothetical protein